MKIIRNARCDNIDEKINAFEKKYDVVLPKEYKSFLNENNGGYVEPEYKVKIGIPTTSEVITFKAFLGFTDKNVDDLNHFNKRFTRVQGAKIVVFATSYEGGLFVINYQDEKIYYWDVRVKMEDSSDDVSAYYLCENFVSLVELIEKCTIEKEKGENMMEKINYLPLGSIIKLNGGIQKLMIVSRGLVVSHKDEEFFFDYAGVMYPEGLMSDQVIYFNSDNISEVIAEGYSDDDDKVIVGNINKYIQDNPDLVWGDVENWNS